MHEKRSIQYKIGATSDSTVWDKAQKTEDARGIQVKRCFINYTSMLVSVIERTGFRNIIEPTHQVDANQFIIRTEYRINRGEQLYNLAKHLNSYDPDESHYPHLQVLKSALEAHEGIGIQKKTINHPPKTGDILLIIDSVFTTEDLKSGDIYAVDQDILLTLSSSDVWVDHPFNTMQTAKDKYEAMFKEHQGVGTFVEIIDNDNTIGDRYLYAFKQIWHIQPVRNTERENGIYFGSIKTINGENSTMSARYDLDDCENVLGLFRTQEEAKTAGDVKALRQEELLRLQHDNQRLALDYARVTQEHKMEVEELKRKAAEEELERKRKTAELEEQLSLSKREHEEFKQTSEKDLLQVKTKLEEAKAKREDFYDTRSYERKDGHELLKITGAVIAAGLAIWLAIAKSK